VSATKNCELDICVREEVEIEKKREEFCMSSTNSCLGAVSAL
jgi:hypothetical protein